MVHSFSLVGANVCFQTLSEKPPTVDCSLFMHNNYLHNWYNHTWYSYNQLFCSWSSYNSHNYNYRKCIRFLPMYFLKLSYLFEFVE